MMFRPESLQRRTKQIKSNSKKNEEKIFRKIKELKIPYVIVGTMEDLGKIFNKEEITVIGIKDKKMAKGLIEEWIKE